MTATQENTTESYAELSNSLAPTYFKSYSCVGSGGSAVATMKGRSALYDSSVITHIVRGIHSHTGAVLRQASGGYLVSGHLIENRHQGLVREQGAVPAVLKSSGSTRVESSSVVPAVTEAALSLTDLLLTVRTAFGLSVSQIANVMLVERVTIYAWMQSNSMDSVRGHNRERLRTLHGIAAEWASKPPLYGKFLRENLPDGSCVFDLLTAHEIDPSALEQAYKALVTIQSPDKRRSAQQRHQRETNRAVGLALGNAFKNFGS